DADSAAEGRELDLCEAIADRAEQALGVFRSAALESVGIGLQESFGAVVHGAGRCLRVQVKGIRSREAHFHQAAAALHGVNAGANKIAVEENVASGGDQVHVFQRRLQNLRVAADGVEVQLTGTLRTDQ